MIDRASGRLASTLEKRFRHRIQQRTSTPFAVELPGRKPMLFGNGSPAFTLKARNGKGTRALASLDRTRMGEAYLRGEIDLEGDVTQVLAIRDGFAERRPSAYLWRLVQPLLFGQVRSDKQWIAAHYDEDPDFFLLFLDRAHRAYSQAVFSRDDESLEDAVTRKMDFAMEATRIKPGDRVLDIGGGWGAFSAYAGKRGVNVTSLTISRASERFINDLIAREKLPCRVVLQHLYEHEPEEPYDAIVNMGVTEHLPDYGASLAKYSRLLKPGGRVYIDASASRTKHDLSSFLLRHLFPGNGSPLCLHEYLSALATSPFQLETVHNDRHNYLLTTRHWAENLDKARRLIEEKWGVAQYRKFQLYLWGCVDGFSRDLIQAYRVVYALPTSARVQQ